MSPLSCLLLVTSLSWVSAGYPKRCSHPSGTISSDIELKKNKDDDGTTITRTVISSNIALRETLCYQISYNHTNKYTGEVKQKMVLYALEYYSLEHVYNYKNSYDFAIPATDVVCWCDCPGGANQCGSDTDSCGRYDKGASCVNFFMDGQTIDGCLWVSGSGQACCSVDIIRFSSDTYKAIEISNPVTRAKFILNIIDMNNGEELVKDKVYNVDLDTGTTADSMVTMNVATSGTNSLLPPGWYFGRVRTGEVKTNIRINSLNEWNMNKMGWMKVLDGTEKIRNRAVREAFSAQTLNCGDNQFNTAFAASYYNRYPDESQDATEYYFSKAEHVFRNDSSRQIIATHRHSTRLDIKLTFNEHSKVIFLYDKSVLKSFNATIRLDKYSNRFINITVDGSAGSIVGSMFVDGREVENIYIYITEDNRKTFSKYIRISAPCSARSTAKLCLKALNEPERSRQCQEVQCLTTRLEDFEIPADDVKYDKGEHDDILSLATWGKYLNPISWFKGGQPGWVEGVIMAAEIIAVIIILGIVIKLAKMFGWFFKCLKCFGFCRKKVKKRLDESETYKTVIMRGGKKGRSQASVNSVVVPMRRTSSRGDDLHYIVVNSDAEGEGLENDYEYMESLDRGKRVTFMGNTKWAV